MLRLLRIYRRLKPDLVQHYTVKPNVYGAIAARLAGVPVVFGGVVGLGSAFAPGGIKRSILRTGVRAFYAIGTALSDRVTFQIDHDAQRLCGNSARRKTQGTCYSRRVIRGPGVCSVRSQCTQVDRANVRCQLGLSPDDLVVTMASRLLYNKGVPEFVEGRENHKGQPPGRTLHTGWRQGHRQPGFGY